MRAVTIVERDDLRALPAMPARVVERRWAIEWSRHGIAFHYRSSAPVMRAGGGRGRIALAAAIGIVGMSALAGAALRPPAPRTPYRVLIAVPEVPVAVAKPAAPARQSAAGRRHVAAPVVAEDAAVVATPTVTAAGERRFYAAAMATGEMQEWVGADGASRYLVAGPVEEQGGRRCRDLALLTRSAGDADAVSHEQRCER